MYTSSEFSTCTLSWLACTRGLGLWARTHKETHVSVHCRIYCTVVPIGSCLPVLLACACMCVCVRVCACVMWQVMNPLVENIAFHKIPVMELMRDVRPLRVVPDGRIMTALAYQADPNAVEANDLQPKSRQAGGSGGSSRNSSPT